MPFPKTADELQTYINQLDLLVNAEAAQQEEIEIKGLVGMLNDLWNELEIPFSINDVEEVAGYINEQSMQNPALAEQIKNKLKAPLLDVMKKIQIKAALFRANAEITKAAASFSTAIDYKFNLSWIKLVTQQDIYSQLCNKIGEYLNKGLIEQACCCFFMLQQAGASMAKIPRYRLATTAKIVLKSLQKEQEVFTDPIKGADFARKFTNIRIAAYCAITMFHLQQDDLVNAKKAFNAANLLMGEQQLKVFAETAKVLIEADDWCPLAFEIGNRAFRDMRFNKKTVPLVLGQRETKSATTLPEITESKEDQQKQLEKLRIGIIQKLHRPEEKENALNEYLKKHVFENALELNEAEFGEIQNLTDNIELAQDHEEMDGSFAKYCYERAEFWIRFKLHPEIYCDTDMAIKHLEKHKIMVPRQYYYMRCIAGAQIRPLTDRMENEVMAQVENAVILQQQNKLEAMDPAYLLLLEACSNYHLLKFDVALTLLKKLCESHAAYQPEFVKNILSNCMAAHARMAKLKIAMIDLKKIAKNYPFATAEIIQIMGFAILYKLSLTQVCEAKIAAKAVGMNLEEALKSAASKEKAKKAEPKTSTAGKLPPAEVKAVPKPQGGTMVHALNAHGMNRSNAAKVPKENERLAMPVAADPPELTL